ncbi:class I SAM-dependent methyltransferase [Nannocystaceae bacterium ST9]
MSRLAGRDRNVQVASGARRQDQGMHVDPDLRYWERHAARYDRSLRLLAPALPRLLARAVASVRGRERVLEVAAGTGLFTTAIAPVVGELIATDYAEAMVERLRARVEAAELANVEVMQADLHALPFAAASVDAVVAANVLHLVPDLPAAIQALIRVVRPGAPLVLPTFVHDQSARARLTSRLLALTGFPGQRRFDVRSLHAALEREGLTIVEAETLPGPIPIAWVVARVDPRVAQST